MLLVNARTHAHTHTHTQDHIHKSFNGDSKEAGNHMTGKETGVGTMSTFPNTTTEKKKEKRLA
jgi:hypothetical protein